VLNPCFICGFNNLTTFPSTNPLSKTIVLPSNKQTTMGFSLTYIAIKGKTPDAILAELDLTATNEFGGFAETPYCAAPLPGGWYLVCENRSADFTKEQFLQKFSLNCEVLTCSVEEHVMVSSASAWQNGKELWSILHESDKGIEHLETKGSLPASFVAIRDDLQSKQVAENQALGGKPRREREHAGTDYIFSIPSSTVQSIIGFTYDEKCPGVPDDSFQVLIPIAKPQSGLKNFFNSFLSRKTNS
jgi:hypothetical protein